jgi:hypothetical protein
MLGIRRASSLTVRRRGRSRPSEGGGRHRRLDAGQSRLQRRLFGVVEPGLLTVPPSPLRPSSTIPVTKVRLQRPRIATRVGQREAARRQHRELIGT